MDQTRKAPAGGVHTAGHRRALRTGALALLVLSVLGAIGWYVVDGLPGLWGALIGAAIGGLFVLVTAGTMVATAESAPQTTAVVLLGTWLLKLVVVLGVVAALKPLDFYSRTALGVTIIVAMVVVLAAEVAAVLRTRAPYVDL